VLRDGRALELEAGLQLRDAPLALAQQVDDAEPGGVPERLEELGLELAERIVRFVRLY
jgi:hypothetical protein